MKSLASANKALANMHPVFEYVMTDAGNSFLWRCDDYPWERNGWNFHPEHEIHLIRNATGVTLVGDFIGQFEPGHLAIVGGGLPHDWVTEVKPGEVIHGRDLVLQFDADRVRTAAAVLPELNEVSTFLTLARRGLAFTGETRRLGAQLLEEIGHADGLGRLSLFIRLLQMLACSSEYVVLSSADFAPALDPMKLGLVQRALAHVFENFMTDIRLADMAELAGMSETAFSRFFKKNSGNSFTDHVTRLRIGRACELLANSNLPVTDICYEVGYSNISNFNRTFLRQRGHTPSAYRRLARRRAG